MSVSVNTIPSINVPLTDKQGRINPIWHEFLRSFVAASVDGTIGGNSLVTTVTAGNGLTATGTTDVTLAVGQGSGIAVNADDVSVDIHGLPLVQAALDDEVMTVDVSDSNNIRKTTVRSMAELASNPGGSNTYVQYNSNGIFGGDSGFTYNGAGGLALSDFLTVNDLTVGGTSGIHMYKAGSNRIYFDGTSASSAARIISAGDGGYSLYATASGIDEAWMAFSGNSPTISFNCTSGSIQMSSTTGIQFTGALPLLRCITNAGTASTTQTQGNGSLTRDYNNISTVAHTNDTVTLPSATSARYCVVKNAGANTMQIFPASGDDLGAGVNNPTTINAGAYATWFALDATTWCQMEGIERRSIAATITASTTQTQGQQPLTKDVNEVSVVANANDTVTLPTAPTYSRTVCIINNGANVLQIFPASGDDLGAGVNTSTTLAAGSNVRYTNYDATNWKAI